MSASGNTTKRRGRRNGLEEARDLIGLLGSLSHEGATISEDAIAQRLGVSKSQAHSLMVAIETVGIDINEPLSLYSQENGQLSVAFERGIHGKPARLTTTETVALNAALNYLHVPENDELRMRLNMAYGAANVDYDAVVHAIMPSDSPAIRQTLETISTALVQRRRIRIEYKGINDKVPRGRDVLPSQVRRNDTSWFLDGIDVTLGEPRTFRVDRIHSCTLGPDATPKRSDPATPATTDRDNTAYYRHPAPARSAEQEPRDVTLHIYDPSVLQDFQWPDLHIIESKPACITAVIPYYGAKSPWLPRQLAACGKKVSCTDERINALKIQYARSQLLGA